MLENMTTTERPTLVELPALTEADLAGWHHVDRYRVECYDEARTEAPTLRDLPAVRL